MPAWAAALLGTFITVFAFCLLALLVWLPAERRRQRSSAIGLLLVFTISMVAAFASAGLVIREASSNSTTGGIEIASPKVNATWASFTTGSNKTARMMADGLQITDVDVGTGPVARTGELLTVRYIMWLTDGKQVDSSDAGGGPFKFTLGTAMVIQGWDEGIPGIGVGGTRRLVIPPALAYGDRGAANESGAYVVPPRATLVFIVQLLSDTPAA